MFDTRGSTEFVVVVKFPMFTAHILPPVSACSEVMISSLVSQSIISDLESF